MTAGGRAGTIAVAVAFGALAVGCVVDDGPRSYGGSVAPSATGTGGGSSGGGSGTTPPGDDQPMLVDVDADRTLNAAPGDGVGVFTEYATGGHWHVWWTCDTARTNQSCSFTVGVAVASGTLSHVAGDHLDTSATLVQPDARHVEAVTTTSTGVDGIYFDAAPGGVITLDASINGTRDGSYLFFVQSGKVNGGYTGKLTDPLMLESTKP